VSQLDAVRGSVRQVQPRRLRLSRLIVSLMSSRTRETRVGDATKISRLAMCERMVDP
jgi:hypothetical protein